MPGEDAPPLRLQLHQTARPAPDVDGAGNATGLRKPQPSPPNNGSSVPRAPPPPTTSAPSARPTVASLFAPSADLAALAGVQLPAPARREHCSGAPRVVLFLVVFVRFTYAQRCLDNMEGMGCDVEVVIIDTGSRNEPMRSWLAQKRAAGYTVVVKQTQGTGSIALRRAIDAVQSSWFQNRKAKRLPAPPYWAVNDPDVLLERPSPATLDTFLSVLDRFPALDAVGPVLRVDDVPADYPQIARLHAKYDQYWRDRPLKDAVTGALVTPTPLDTTLSFYRAGYKKRSFTKNAVRLHYPYSARHVDWYVTPQTPMTADMEEYRRMAALNHITHWSGQGKSATRGAIVKAPQNQHRMVLTSQDVLRGAAHATELTAESLQKAMKKMIRRLPR